MPHMSLLTTVSEQVNIMAGVSRPRPSIKKYMRFATFVAAAVIVSLVLVDGPAWAQVPVDDHFKAYCRGPNSNPYICAENALETLRATQKYLVLRSYCDINPATAVCADLSKVESPVLLRYDHPSNRWDDDRAYRSEFKRRARFDMTVTGPVVRLARQERVGIAVIRTNPLLFSASLSVSKTADVEQIAAAKDVLATLGEALASFTATSAMSTPAKMFAIAVSPTGASTSKVALLDTLNETTAWFSDKTKALRELESGMLAVKAQTERLESAGQLAEAARLRPGGPARMEVELHYDPDVSEWDRKWGRLSGEYAHLVSGCRELWPDKWNEGSDEVVLTSFEARLAGSQCGLPMANPAGWMGWRQLATGDKTAARNGLGAIKRSLDAADALSKVTTDKPPAIIAGALRAALHRVRLASVMSVVTPVSGFVSPGNAISPHEAARLTVGDQIFVHEADLAGRWHESVTYDLKVTRRKAIAEAVATDLPAEAGGQFKVERSWLSAFGFSTGLLVLSGATVDTFEVVKSDSGSTVEIAKRTGTAGQIAAFANVRPLEFRDPFDSGVTLRPGIEIGATTGDNPGLLAGLSVETFRVFRIGAGFGWWRVPRLVGKRPGESVDANYTVRTEDRIGSRARYVSLTVSLNSLSLFSK